MMAIKWFLSLLGNTEHSFSSRAVQWKNTCWNSQSFNLQTALLHLAKAIFGCSEWSMHPSILLYGNARTGQQSFAPCLWLLGLPSAGAPSPAILIHKKRWLIARLNVSLLSNKLTRAEIILSGAYPVFSVLMASYHPLCSFYILLSHFWSPSKFHNSPVNAGILLPMTTVIVPESWPISPAFECRISSISKYHCAEFSSNRIQHANASWAVMDICVIPVITLI